MPRTEDLPPVGPLPLPARIYASSSLRRVVPWQAAVAAARLKADLAWRRSDDTRRSAREAMSWLVGRSSRAGEVESLARRHVIANAERSELEWRPQLGAAFVVEPGAVDIMRAVRRDGGGMLLHFLHHGPYVHITGAMRAAGLPLYAPISKYFFGEPLPGLTGHKDRAHLRALSTHATVFPAEGSGAAIPELLARGEIVAIASDLPGRLPSTFLGRRVGVASGVAKIAQATSTPIVCVTWRRRPGRLPTLTAAPPLDPGAFAGPAEVQRALFAVHEPAILTWPEALERPLERWTRLEDDAAPDDPSVHEHAVPAADVDR